MLSRRHLLAAWPLLSAAQTAATRLYHVVFLRRRPDRQPLSKEQGERIQAAHMANIHAMADRGVMVAAGPFDDTPPSISGVFFFVTPSLEEARRVAEADPTVVERRNTVEILTWRGPAGLGDEYRRLHKEKPDTPEDMGVHPFFLLRRAGQELDEKLLGEHRAYWARWRKSGELLAFGPVEGDQAVEEILIFGRIPDPQAKALAAHDPAVLAGRLTVETHRWWSAAHIFPR